MINEQVGLVMPEVIVKRTLEMGLAQFRANPALLDQVFNTYKMPAFSKLYGQSYIDKIKGWVQNTKIPVVFGFNDNVDKVPSYSVHLSPEREDETRAAMNDFYGEDDAGVVGVGVFKVSLDIGCHGDKSGDYAIWLYYMANNILFQNKEFMESHGLTLVTFGADAQKKEVKYASENIWSRFISMQTTVVNSWYKQLATGEFDVSVSTYLEIGNETVIEI
jgi:hypothetical protein